MVMSVSLETSVSCSSRRPQKTHREVSGRGQVSMSAAQKDALAPSNVGKGFKEKLENVSPCDVDDCTSLIFLQKKYTTVFFSSQL